MSQFCERSRVGPLADGVLVALVALNVLNVADWALTMDGIALGICYEANPIMAAALEYGHLAAFLGKVGLVAAGSLVLWHLRATRLAPWAILGLAAFYAGIVMYQSIARLFVL